MSPSQLIFFGLTPELKSLCHVKVRLPHGAANGRSHIVKCREIIFTEPLVIATPCFGELASLSLILPIEYYKSGKLLTRLKKLNLKIEEPEDVSERLYNACFRYTLMAKMAPNWNEVGGNLVHGRDFLIHKGKKDAVQFDIQFTNSQFTVTVAPLSIALSHIELEDLEITQSLVDEFRRNSNTLICEASIGHKWCHVLPSHKKGQIVQILNKLPADSGFSSYKDIKRYWKNNYGYRLPETEDNIYYVQVYFKPIGEKPFTYPNLCVVNDGSVSQTSRADQTSQNFIADIKKYLKSVCGTTLKLSASPWIPDVQLSTAYACDVHDVSRINSKPKPHPTSTAIHSLPVGADRLNENNCAEKSNPLCARPAFNFISAQEPCPSKTYSSEDGKVPGQKPAPILPPFMASARMKVTNMQDSSKSFGCTLESLNAAKQIPSFKATLNGQGNKSKNSDETRLTNPEPTVCSSKAVKRPLETLETPHAQCKGSKLSKQFHQKQEVPNIPELASRNMLSIAKSAGLAEWLKSQGIACKAKENKASLIEKVKKACQNEP